MKRVIKRENGSQTHVDVNNFGLNYSNVIGWFTNKYNPLGWSIHNLTDFEKAEFGHDCFRTLSVKGNTAIIKINFEKGTYSFIDNSLYESGVISFEKATPYTKAFLD